MFDRVEIVVKGGDGGDGAITFRREKYAPQGGPDGGRGGPGGNVLVVASGAINSLRSFRKNRVYRAGDGGGGGKQKRQGRTGTDLALEVPPGTIAWDRGGEEPVVLADLEQIGQQATIARGGQGGWGNVRYASPTNQVPRLAQRGDPGEEKRVTLELRLIADVGIIGFPNVGKSSLLACASNAKPKIADYPFTTLEPVLGVVEVGNRTFVMAEIPGLIEGAHAGKGLGFDFLRHALRTKVLIHLLNGTSESPVEDWRRVNNELSLFDASLWRKPQLVVVNKVDLPEVRARMPQIKSAFQEASRDVRFVSAVTGEGVSEVMAEAVRMLAEVAAGAETPEAKAVFRPKPRRAAALVRAEDGAFILTSPDLERVCARVNTSDTEVRRQLREQINKTGLGRVLEKAGIQAGDKVRCGEWEWEW